MSPQDLDTIKALIQDTVKQVVNGKIDNLNRKFDAHILFENERWEQIQPVVSTFNNYSGFRKVVTSWAIIVGAVIGAGAGVSEIVNIFKR